MQCTVTFPVNINLATWHQEPPPPPHRLCHRASHQAGHWDVPSDGSTSSHVLPRPPFSPQTDAHSLLHLRLSLQTESTLEPPGTEEC